MKRSSQLGNLAPAARRSARRLGRCSTWALLVGLCVGLGSTAAQARTPADFSIAADIEGELLATAGIPANDIDVIVRDGVVTFRGTIDHMLARERVMHIASTTNGVRSVVDRLVVEHRHRDDAEVRADVRAALSADPAAGAWEIGVGVRDGVVTLSGEVESQAAKQLAVAVAKTVRGVRDVRSDIDVDLDVGRPDADIRTVIRKRLRWDARVDDALIEVQVAGGEVRLSGSVGTLRERSLVMADAWIAGVTGVDASGLEVARGARARRQRTTRWGEFDDAAIRDAVEDAMRRDPRVKPFNPSVAVAFGSVTLTGVVGNLKSKRAAARDAENTAGVLRVDNDLEVHPETVRADDAVAKDIREAFARAPVIEATEITVEVSHGEANLYGRVDSRFDKRQAEDLAAGIIGVTEIQNHLMVDY